MLQKLPTCNCNLQIADAARLISEMGPFKPGTFQEPYRLMNECERVNVNAESEMKSIIKCEQPSRRRRRNSRAFNHRPRRPGFAGICFNKFQQIKTYKTYSTLQGESRGADQGDPRSPTRDLGARVMDNECANASRRHPHKSMQPPLYRRWSAI